MCDYKHSSSISQNQIIEENTYSLRLMSRYLCPYVIPVVVLQSPCVSQNVLWQRVLITACPLQSKMTPQEKLKLRMQKALNKQCESCTFLLHITLCRVFFFCFCIQLRKSPNRQNCHLKTQDLVYKISLFVCHCSIQVK